MQKTTVDLGHSPLAQPDEGAAKFHEFVRQLRGPRAVPVAPKGLPAGRRLFGRRTTREGILLGGI